MSTSSPSPEPPQQEHTHESDVVFEETLNQETPNQPDPVPKTDPEAILSPQRVVDPEDNSQEEEDDEEEEGEEVDEGQEQETPAISSGMSLPPITDLDVSVPDVTLTSASNDPNPRQAGKKRKKGKGKSKGKPNVKTQQAIEEKLQTLMTKLNPIPFIPHRLLDFAKHEKLLKKLGLWDFVHIDFDRDIRVDLIAQLVATYKANLRASYVNGFRIMVNRADLARAFKLPLKKDKGNVGGVEVDLDSEVLLDDSIGFIDEFVSGWVLLHEDTWAMPNEVLDWLKLIKEGHPEKVDWAGLFWFMVKKELKQGGQLRECYYASHLQHLIKFQREEAFLRDEPAAEAVELDAEAKDEEDEVNDGDVKGDGGIGGPSTELTLGQDGEKEEGAKDVEMMDGEKCNDSDEEHGQWLLNGKNNMGDHFMQPCGAENAGEFGSYEERKEEEEEEEMDQEEDEEEEGDKYVFPNDDAIVGDGFTGNLLQVMEGNQMAFGSQDQLRNPSSVDMTHIGSAPSFFNDTGKRVIEHDNHIDDNKRLRINESWSHKPIDFGTCMEKIQQMTEQARLFYEEKEQSLEQSNMNQQILLNELQKRDNVIEHLHKTRLEETQKKDGQIYRLERELYLMGSVLDGYKKALKETQRAFREYRRKAQLPEEPTYKDAGPGGLMLSTAEIERIRKKQEEEFKMNCLIIEHKMKEAEENYAGQFEGFVEKINLLDKKLTGLEANAKELTELHAKQKTSQTEEKVPEGDEPEAPEGDEPEAPEGDEPEAPEGNEPVPVQEEAPEGDEPVPVKEEAPEGDEPVPVKEAAPEGNEPVPVKEEAPEGDEPLPIKEEAPEGDEPLPVEEKAPEVVETQPNPQPEAKVPEVTEPLPNE